MSVQLPEGLTPDDELDVRWERDEFSTKITVNFGEATIVVEHSEDATELVPWLVGALPAVLTRVAQAIDNEEGT